MEDKVSKTLRNIILGESMDDIGCGIYKLTSLHRDHPGLRITMMTAPFSLHSSSAVTILLEPSRAARTAPLRAGKENGTRLELWERG